MRRYTVEIVRLAFLGGLGWGCGDPLRDATYQGEALLTLSGEILVQRELKAEAASLRVAIFWMFQADEELETSEQVSVETAFPALYQMKVYLPPPESVRTLGEHPLAVGFPLLYLDEDGDGRWGVGTEAVVGGTSQTYLMFTEEGFYDPEGNRLLDVGYTAVHFDACSGDQPAPPPHEVSPDGANMEIGPSFLDNLVDMDCDGDLDEWEGLCLGGCVAE